MYTSYDDKKVVFTHEKTYEVLNKWVNHNSLPSIIAFCDSVMDYLFEQGNSVLFILYDPESHEKELLEIEEHSKILRTHGYQFHYR